METITAIYSWLKANIGGIIAIWVAAIGIAEVIVKWTDSKKDDAVLGKIRAAGIKIISWLTKLGFETEKATK